MPNDRRYGDDEVRKIFDDASRGSRDGASESVDEHGLTLAELQEVGSEVGIDPARIAEAAAALEGAPSPIRARRLLGQPVSVGRVVELPRAPSDREWERLVAELRTTFGAKGRVATSGSLREWSNGNLTALVEPTGQGYQLRLHTVKGSALRLRRVSTVALAFSAILAVVFVLQDAPEVLTMSIMWAVFGAAAVASPLLTLPPWARERERQMEHIAQRAQALLAE